MHIKNKINKLVGARITGVASAALATIIILCVCVSTQAAPVIYTFSGVGTGGLGANSFNNASFTITATADTSQITDVGAGILHVVDESATISVSGIGSGTFDISTINVVNQNFSRVGFSDPGDNLAILFVVNPDFANYFLDTSIGPETGTPVFNAGSQFGTTAGNFSLTSVSTATFQATVVPEPAASSLFALAGFAYVIWRKRIYS